MFLLFGLLAGAVGGGFFGVSHFGDEEEGRRRQNEIAASLFNGLNIFGFELQGGFEALGIFNFFADIFNMFLPDGQKIAKFDIATTGTPGEADATRSLFEFAKDIEDVSPETAQNIRSTLANQLATDVGLEPAFAEALSKNDAALSDLSKIIADAGIGMNDLVAFSSQRGKILAPRPIQQIFESDDIFETFVESLDVDVRQKDRIRGNHEHFETEEFARSLSAELLKPENSDRLAEVFEAQIMATIIDNTTDQQLAEDLMDLFSNKETLIEALDARIPAAAKGEEADRTAQIEMAADFLHKNSENLKTIFGEEDFGKIARTLLNDGSNLAEQLASNPSQFLSIVMTHPDFTSVKDNLIQRIIDGDDVESALKELNLDMFADSEKAMMTLGLAYLTGENEAGTGSNLDVFASEADLLNALLQTFSGGEGRVTEDQKERIGALYDQTDIDVVIRDFKGDLTGAGVIRTGVEGAKLALSGLLASGVDIKSLDIADNMLKPTLLGMIKTDEEVVR